MRLPLLSTGLLLALNTSAQDWALLNPVYKYNYSNDGSDTISNQIFITEIDTLGPDSIVFQLNRRAQLCPTCLPACNLKIDEPRFLMRTCTLVSDVWTFSDTLTFVLHPKAPLGSTWLFMPGQFIGGGIIGASSAIIHGVVDSVKTFVSAAADTIIWSKSFGIISWVSSGMGSQIQVGLHGPDLGTLVPSVGDFYRYNPGDVVEYVSTDFEGGGGYYGGRRWQLQILSRTDYQDSVVFGAYRYLDQWSQADHTYSNGPVTWTVRHDHSLLRTMVTSPGDFLSPLGTWSTAFDSFSVGSVVRHRLLPSGHYEVSADPAFNLMLFSYYLPLDSPCVLLFSSGFNPMSLVFDTEVGLRIFSYGVFQEGHSTYWVGAVISGDTLGTISTHEYFHVGIDELRTSNVVHVFPNPASDNVTIASALELGPWVISDALGRVVLSGNAGGRSSVEVSVLEIPVAAYLLHVFSPTGVVSKRLMVVR